MPRLLPAIVIAAAAGCGRFDFAERGTGDAASDATIDAPIVLSFEAESGALVAPFMVVADASASGGEYVIDGNPMGITGAGSVTISVAIAQPGTYYVWARVLAV